MSSRSSKWKQKLAELKGADCEDVEEMLAEFNRRFDACSSWLGSEVEVDYEKVQMFVGKCSSSVKIEYADFISPKYNGEGVDEMTIEWGEFEELIRKVWKAAVMKSQIRDELGVGVDAGTVPDVKKTKQTRKAPAAPKEESKPIAVGFVKIDCVECKKKFSPSSLQIAKHEEQGMSLPEKCPKCKGQVCNLFEADGVCPYGDECKFLHPDELKKEVSADNQSAAAPTTKKHSYSCRYHRLGKCLSGDACLFQHEGDGEVVHSAVEVYDRSRQFADVVKEHKDGSDMYTID